jgi:hypothetical protein
MRMAVSVLENLSQSGGWYGYSALPGSPDPFSGQVGHVFYFHNSPGSLALFAAILRASSLLSNLPMTQAVRAARRAALWGLGGPPFCKPFGKCFVSGYRTLEARLLVSFEASTAALQQPLPTMR